MTIIRLKSKSNIKLRSLIRFFSITNKINGRNLNKI